MLSSSVVKLSLCDTYLGYSNGLPICTPSCLLEVLGNLSRFSRACLAHHNGKWTYLKGIKKTLAMSRYGQQGSRLV